MEKLSNTEAELKQSVTYKKTCIRLMTLNRIKLGRAVTFMKYLASVVSLIFLPKTLNWNKITFPASNLLNLAKAGGK